MLAVLHFRLDGSHVGETRCGAVPVEGQVVTIEHGMRGRLRTRVVGVNHQFTDSGTRRVEMFVPAPIIVDLTLDEGPR
jgi:hypothetical protein